ncbi:YSIRK-type signal peptide-containing protein [Streptococcus sp. ZJ93]
MLACFSIRKYSIGVTSVVLIVWLFLASQSVSAVEIATEITYLKKL